MNCLEAKPFNIDQELRDLLCELEWRKQVNPLSLYEHLPYQRRFHQDDSKVKGLFGGNRCIPLFSPILKADGTFIPLSEIKVGDWVICDSKPVQVTETHRTGVKKCYGVSFEDGGELVASEKHSFPISFGSGRKFIKRPLGELLKRGNVSISKKARFQSYKNIVFKRNVALPLHPYLMGALLGDGSLTKNSLKFSNSDMAVITRIDGILKTYGYELKKYQKYDYGIKSIYPISRKNNGQFGPSLILNIIKSLGLVGTSKTKFIPNDYKTASVDDRKLLVAGLIDTDGCKDEYCSQSKQLADDFCFVIKSLGGKATMSRTEKICYNSKTKAKGIYWRVYWRLNDTLPLSLSKKQEHSKREPNYTSRVVKSIKFIGAFECGDLTVNHTSHNYVSWDWIVTGNSGKTEEGAEYILSKCLAKPKQRWWACAETFQDSVNIQQRKIWELLPKNRVKYGRYDEINGFTNRKLLFDNKSMIIFKSYDQGREAFASDDIDGIWNDEEPPYDLYKEQRMRLMDRDGEMIFTMTSLKGVTDLIQDLFEDHAVIESKYAEYVRKELPRIIAKNGMKFYMLWTLENPYIKQARVLEEVKLMPKDEILARIYGIPINLSGKIYMMFNKSIHTISFDDLPDLKDCTLYHILDPHDRKPWAMIWVAVHKTETCYVIDEYPNRNFNDMAYDDKTYDDYARVIREKEDALVELGCNRVYKRIIDPNFGNKTMQLAERQGGQAKITPKEQLRKLGLKFIDGIDSIEAGHLAVRSLLHYEKKDDEIVVQPRLLIADNCENTIRHHSLYSRKDVTTTDGDVKDKVALKEKYKDFPDLTRYFAMSNPKHIDNSDIPKEQPHAERLY